MEIIFKGKHDSIEAAESLQSIIRMFKERYHIQQFREMHLSLTLVDEQGDDVELVDSETATVYRVFEVHREGCYELSRGHALPSLRLVVDNTR